MSRAVAGTSARAPRDEPSPSHAEQHPPPGLLALALALFLFVGWWCLCVATLGWYRAWSAPSAAVAVVAAWWLIRRRRAARDGVEPEAGDRAARVILAGVIAVAVLAWNGPPSEYVIGARDPGVYVNTGIRIAKHGSIGFDDPELAFLQRAGLEDAFIRDRPKIRYGFERVWSRPSRLAGFYIRERTQSEIVPHGLHLFPVWIAIFASLGGVGGALWTTPLVAALGAMLFALSLFRSVRPAAALVGSVGLVACVVQTWHARVPSAEVLCQALLWAGAFCFLHGDGRGGCGWLVLAGIAWGEILLTKVDGALLAGLVVVALLALRPRHAPAVLAGFLPPAIHGLLHAAFVSTAYSLDTLAIALHERWFLEALTDASRHASSNRAVWGVLALRHPWLVVAALAGAAGVASAGMAFVRVRRWLRRSGRITATRVRWLGGAAALVAIGGVALSSSVSPLVPMLKLYVGPVILVGSALGLVVGARAGGTPRAVLIVLAFASALEWIVVPQAFAREQLWASRRLLPGALPGVFAGLALLVDLVSCRLRDRRARTALSVVLAVALVLRLAPDSLRFRGTRELEGATGAVEALAAAMQPSSVCLIDRRNDGPRLAAPLWTWGACEPFLVESSPAGQLRPLPAIRAWRARGARVYWLGEASEPPATLLARIPVADRGAVEWRSRCVEGAVDRVPEAVVECGATLAVLELDPATVAATTGPR
ncbi:MAG: hypothetical protein U0610_03595 [bacterium]